MKWNFNTTWHEEYSSSSVHGFYNTRMVTIDAPDILTAVQYYNALVWVQNIDFEHFGSIFITLDGGPV
jgi:hypothetical protein